MIAFHHLQPEERSELLEISTPLFATKYICKSVALHFFLQRNSSSHLLERMCFMQDFRTSQQHKLFLLGRYIQYVRELKLLGTSIKINHTTRYLPQHKLDAGIYNLILANEKFVDRINNITECLCAPVCVCQEQRKIWQIQHKFQLVDCEGQR